MRTIRLLSAILLLALMVSCATVPATIKPPAMSVSAEGSSASEVYNFGPGGGIFTGGAGAYIVTCSEEGEEGKSRPQSVCTANVLTLTECSNARGGVYTPGILVSHNQQSQETRMFSDRASGNWVITEKPISGCIPEVVFTVLLPNGGAVVKSSPK